MKYIGEKYGRLTITDVFNNTKGRKMAKCICECGNMTNHRLSHIICGSIKSCGCLHIENIKKANLAHGQSKTPLYKEWLLIKSRCNNVNNNRYYRYGGRGIKMCDEWQNSFENFYDWAKDNYEKGLQIDRINNNWDYCPENCRWVTCKENNNNRHDNRILEYNNQKMTMAQWAEVIGINYKTVANRLYKGWSIERALTEKLRKRA